MDSNQEPKRYKRFTLTVELYVHFLLSKLRKDSNLYQRGNYDTHLFYTETNSTSTNSSMSPITPLNLESNIFKTTTIFYVNILQYLLLISAITWVLFLYINLNTYIIEYKVSIEPFHFLCNSIGLKPKSLPQNDTY